MAEPVTLVPLVCSRCQNPIAAQGDEIAWVCGQCGQGLLLSDEKGAVPLDIHFSKAVPSGKSGRPFWVARGKAALQREIYGGGNRANEAAAYWAVPHAFVIPAYTCSLSEAIQLGQQYLDQPPLLEDGSAVPFTPVTLLPEDVRAFADFILVAVEAARPDKIKELKFNLELENPTLWILP